MDDLTRPSLDGPPPNGGIYVEGDLTIEQPGCTCTPYEAGGDGPEMDCPVHGVMCVCGQRLGTHAATTFRWSGERSPYFGLLAVVEGCDG